MNSARTLSYAVVITALAVTGAAAQDRGAAGKGSVLQAPGPQYQAGGLHRFLLGREYRSLWTTPVSAPVLNLQTYAGGLRAVSRGGGKQTKSLLLVAPDGRQFFFRAVDKDASVLLPEDLRVTVAGSVVRDQTSSALPTAPLVVSQLLTAAEIKHADEHLFVLPRGGQLGEFDAEFGGLMGFLQERVGGAQGPPSHWDGASEIIGSDTLIARVGQSPDDRVDARAYATARLFDVFIGDWDRHRDQWVWVRYGDALPRQWLPVPRDRDQAFAKYDGLLFYFARQTAPQLTNFGRNYSYMPGATWNGRDLDRRLLVELERRVWDSLATALQAKLTDSVIEAAVRRLPPEHYRLQGAALTDALRNRRDRLPEAAKHYYELLAGQVDVTGTEEPEEARVTRIHNGDVELTLSRRGGAGPPYFTRRFERGATHEIRIFLNGGDDGATVRGDRGGIRLRILGEAGSDWLVDSSRVGEKFYDDPAGPTRTSGLASPIDRRPYAPPPQKNPNALPPRDWGQRWAVNPWASYGPDMGALLGATAALTIYGFRKYPYASRHQFRAGFATGPKTYRAAYRGEIRREHSRGYADILAYASGIDVINFHGFGNEIAAPQDAEFYRVTQDALGLQPSLAFSLADGNATIKLGPILKYVSTDDRPGRFLSTLGDLYGTGNFGEVGGGLDFQFDSRDRSTAPTRGVLLELGGKVYPAIWDVGSTFGEVRGLVTTYLTAPVPLNPTLALRAGGRKLWGTYPYFEAAFLGDVSNVRLGRINRYAGDASAYGSAELRLALGRALVVLPADIGVFGLADAGRVFLEGESSDKWHTAVGGGLWLAFLDRAHTLSVAVASSEERTGVYLQAGFGF
jgi:hypothetical protein